MFRRDDLKIIAWQTHGKNEAQRWRSSVEALWNHEKTGERCRYTFIALMPIQGGSFQKHSCLIRLRLHIFFLFSHDIWFCLALVGIILSACLGKWSVVFGKFIQTLNISHRWGILHHSILLTKYFVDNCFVDSIQTVGLWNSLEGYF